MRHQKAKLKSSVAGDPEALKKASRLHREGLLDQARGYYQIVLARQPSEGEALNGLCHIELQAGRAVQALRLISRAIKAYPRNHRFQLSAGAVRHRLGHFAEALDAYSEAIALNPDFAHAYLQRGNLLRDLQRPGEAILDYDRAIALKPDFAEAYNNKSVTLRGLKRYNEALASITTSIEYNPGSAGAHNNHGAVLTDLNRLTEALQCFDRALACDPGFAGALNNRGITLRSLKRFAEALDCFDIAIALDPNQASSHSNRGNILADLGRPAEALESYARASALEPHHAESHNNRGLVLAELGDLASSRKAIEHAIRLLPGRARFYFNLTEVASLAAADPHIQTMERMITEGGTLPASDRIDLHFALGKAYADQNREAESFAHILAGNALKRRQTPYDETATLKVLDRVREAFTRERLSVWPGAGDPDSVPIFIIGMPRSGSTLAEQILAAHGHVHAAGEIDDFERSIQSAGGTGAEMTPETLAALPPLALRQAGAGYVRRLRRTAPDALRITNKKLSNFRIAGLIHMALPNAKIIHTRRNPIDTCVSCFSKQFADDLPYTYGLAEMGRYYRAYEGLMAHWREVLPPGVMLELHYEEVVADFEGQARRLLAHCGLGWDPRCLDFHEAKRPVRTASRTQVRQPLYGTSVGRWRPHAAALGPLFEALGINAHDAMRV